MLAQKVEAVEKSAGEAQEALQQLTVDRDAKVRRTEECVVAFTDRESKNVRPLNLKRSRRREAPC